MWITKILMACTDFLQCQLFYTSMLIIQDREEFDAIFSAWKRSPNSNFHRTRIDRIHVNNVFFNYFCVADVTYSRLDNKGNTINQQRLLYNFVKGDKFGPLGLLIKWFKKWKIYMITNVEIVE